MNKIFRSVLEALIKVRDLICFLEVFKSPCEIL